MRILRLCGGMAERKNEPCCDANDGTTGWHMGLNAYILLYIGRMERSR